jgi:hypothetical protein
MDNEVTNAFVEIDVAFIAGRVYGDDYSDFPDVLSHR